mmetsp:Transcript_42960/g.68704  ORF Transcript_42960/g.68704 Transcript_42960/m.68704 type:complete len:450 (-) Transcript_42960:59-1408(-)
MKKSVSRDVVGDAGAVAAKKVLPPKEQPKAKKNLVECRHLDKVGPGSRSIFSASSGKFLISGRFPPTMEKPLTDRNFEMLPKIDIKGINILRENGIAVLNSKGMKGAGDNTIGQDALSVSYLGNGLWIYVVADGHGLAGDTVASHVMVALPYFMASAECMQLITTGQHEAAFETAFRLVQKDVETMLGKMLGDDLKFSGTTCVCMLGECGSKIVHIAHVGDSKAIMIHPNGSVMYRTEDHKPENAKERVRVEEKGCEVVEITYEDGARLVKINLKGQSSPAISFTRSFGDTGVKAHGVHASPEVSRWAVREETSDAPRKSQSLEKAGNLLKRFGTKFMGANSRDQLEEKTLDQGHVLLASDGIWEFMTCEEVALFVATLIEQGINGQETLHQLVLEARERWRKEEDNYCDDITAILVPSTILPVVLPKVADKKSSCCGCFAACKTCTVM